MQMDETTFIVIAAQLRKPEGTAGIETGLQMNQSNRHMNLFAIEALRMQENDKVLEIGMGNGEFIREIIGVHPSVRYTGADYSATMIDEATKRNQQAITDGQVEFVLSTANFLPFEDNTFDKVLCVNTLYFWEPVAELSELRRVLKPGGILVAAIRPKSIMENFPFTQYGFTLYSDESLSQTLSAAGFAVGDLIIRQEPEVQVDDRKHTFTTVIAVAEAKK